MPLKYCQLSEIPLLTEILLRIIQPWELRDNTVLNCGKPPDEALQPILREKAEIEVAALKKRKTSRDDNIHVPVEYVQAGGKTVIDVSTSVTRSGDKENRIPHWLSRWLINSLKGQPAPLSKLQTISLISHSSKVMLKVILNRPHPQPKRSLLKKAGFRAGRSTTK